MEMYDWKRCNDMPIFRPFLASLQSLLLLWVGLDYKEF